MAIMLWQAVKYLSESGLLTPAEAESERLKFLANQPDGDAKAFIRELVRLEVLTSYQSLAIYQGKPQGLVYGQYVVIDKIASGGMGVVLKARHRLMNRIVALKILPPSAIQSASAVRRFRREVEAAARLTHPNIITAHDAGEEKGVPYLVLEYVDGSDLAHYVREHERLPLGEAIDFILQAAAGLEHVHRQGVIHRDIKPANLLVDDFGHVKILDMGLARFANGLGDGRRQISALTEVGSMMGTIDYMSPEQAFDAMQVDQRADIYSLGCTFYNLLTGMSAYSGNTLMERLAAHREDTIPDLCILREDVPNRLQEIFARMVAKKREDRYPTVTEVIADLRQLAVPKESWKPAPGKASTSPAFTGQELETLPTRPVANTKTPDQFRTVSPQAPPDTFLNVSPAVDPPAPR